MTALRLMLASASPRRKDLLQQLGLSPEIAVADIDETPLADEPADRYVMRLARAKGQVIADRCSNTGDAADTVIVAADTIIALQGNLLGKPQSKQDAFSMWQQMSDGCHEVLTAVAVFSPQGCDVVLNRNQVVFSAIDAAAMDAYWETGEPQDKAGAYAIQGYAAAWVKEITGSYSGIMGLPLYETAALLKQHGVKTLL